MRRAASYRAATLLLASSLLALAACSDGKKAATVPGESPVGVAAEPGDAALIERGAYLARAGDCMACHSLPGKPPYAGGLAIESAVGTIYSTNITPDAAAGIGRYTEQQFADALRKGLRADGKHLYPAMPYPDYVKTTDGDIHALYVYFRKGVKASGERPPETSLSFPFNMRWGMAIWNRMFGNDKPFAAPDGASGEVARGAYLVQGLGHCGSCHTPRGLAMNEKAYDDSGKAFLSGGELGGWQVPALRGMPNWSKEQIAHYLATGRNSTAAVAGEMTSVVANSTSYLSEADLAAIAAYLKSLPADQPAHPSNEEAARATTARLTAATGLGEGERLYLDNCAACHFVDGQGAPRVFPRLDGATLVNAGNPAGLVDIILSGAQTPSTARAPSILPMPGFAQRLSDKEVAELATFVRGAWSNKAASVSESEVAKGRKALHGG